ncbi:MAG: endonuclease MutS2 [Oscillospiraceae bacterium]|jgi:DNA mismatch repair protein MutS2|nr:endonuclease MutS2 [Oscillospiraceae bacterium]
MKAYDTTRHYRAVELDKILEKLASHCAGEEAAQLARSLEPSSDLNIVASLLRQTNDAHMLTARFTSPPFGGLHSVSGSLRRAAAGSILTMAELLRIAQVLGSIRNIRDWRSRSEGVQTCLDTLFMSLTPNRFLEDKIKTSILSEDEIADSASSELASIRRKIRAAQSKVREQLDKLIRSTTYQKYLQDSIVTMRGGRFVVPVKSECRGSVAGLVHDTSSSGSTVFIEPMGVVESNNEIRVLQGKEEAEIERILAALSVEAGDFAEGIIRSHEVMVELSLIFAKSNLAYSMKATLPLMNGEGEIELRKSRHPLIEPDKVVATDIRLGTDFDTLVITGPNTGGKTVALKTLGLFTLMAMCGLMIPAAENSRLSVFQNVLADIGDEQSIEQSLSTFSAHMTNIQSIIGQANRRSLVLLDELGAGTDPVEGAALAMSILEHLHGKGAKIAATTHYSELKSYALNSSGVENGCCEFDVATLRPTYKLLIGVPGRSNAFAISEKLGIPSLVIERAGELISAENHRFEETVEKLESYRRTMEEQKSELEQIKNEAEDARSVALEQKEKSARERERQLELARADAKRIVDQARRQAEALLDELDALRKLKADTEANTLATMAKQELRSKIKDMEDLADPVNEREKAQYKLPRALKAGDAVLIYDIDKKGIVLKPLNSQGYVEVQAGVIKTRVKLDNLRLLPQEKVTVNNKSTGGRNTKDVLQKTASMDLDIRGQNVDEAVMELDRFIDSCTLMGLNQITIIHGKGTGALRAGIHTHLRRHPNIRTFRLGVYGEGEDGVTIAELK